MPLVSSIRPTLAAGAADSLFTWTFQATSGDLWGGWLVDDTVRYVPGSTIVTPHGRYLIVAQEDRGQDLSAFGLEEGQVFVSWYRDAASGQFLATRAGDAVASGTGGLGTEADAAWNGTAWDGFGLGGADQANLTERPDSLFTWVFVSDAGDTLWGSLHADSAEHAAGDTLRGASGTYRILEEAEYGRDTGTPEGTVHTTRYRDAGSRLHLQLESAGAAPTGLAGLGSELDRAFDGVEWDEVGLGGMQQADRRPDARFTYRFEAEGGGDSWTGWLVGHAPLLQPGAVIPTPHGQYRILAEERWSGPPALDGSVWITAYRDAESGTSLLPQAWGQRGERAGALGLGSERDVVWDGNEWEAVGLGGALQAGVERNQPFTRLAPGVGDPWPG